MDAVALMGSLAACAAMVGAAALTAWRVDAVSRRGGEADDPFWLAFGGAVVIAGAGVVAAALGAAWPAFVVGVASSTAAVAWTWRRHDQRHRRAEESSREAARKDLQRRHDDVLRRWADYDVDPGKAIHYPGMHDSGNPAVRPVVRAVRAAGSARDAVMSSPGDEAGEARYATAVARLEHAFAAAERDLGALEPRRPGRHRAIPGRP
ncbi:hypothetical protein [Arthrobacter antioxidans]|uniref:hypothetical protein n=1 Tax=Arthrobacter antioxidans TaxID=2895818 RepID=UPI001FFEE4AC|nr:hypothetical protein [Arthrobacter antioxidans]